MSKESKRVEYFAGLLEKALIKNRRLQGKLDEMREQADWLASEGGDTGLAGESILEILNK